MKKIVFFNNLYFVYLLLPVIGCSQKSNEINVTPIKIAEFRVGSSEVFPEAYKEINEMKFSSVSYLPADLVYFDNGLYFLSLPKYHLVKLDLKTNKVIIDSTFIEKNNYWQTSQNVSTNSKYLCVWTSRKVVVFDKKKHKSVYDSKDKLCYVFPISHDSLLNFCNHNYQLIVKGKVVKDTVIRVGGYYFYNDKEKLSNSSYEEFNVSKGIPKEITSTKMKNIFQEFPQNENYLTGIELMGRSNNYYIWVKRDIKNSNEIILSEISTGNFYKKIVLSKNIVNENILDQFDTEESLGEPIEDRQYIRIAAKSDKDFYFMIQSKGIIYVYSFSIY